MADDMILAQRRWAYLETAGALIITIGFGVDQPALMAFGAGILACQIGLALAAGRRLALFHGPVMSGLIGVSLFFQRPFYEGLAWSLLLFSLLDLPKNMLILFSSMKALRKKIAR